MENLNFKLYNLEEFKLLLERSYDFLGNSDELTKIVRKLGYTDKVPVFYRSLSFKTMLMKSSNKIFLWDKDKDDGFEREAKGTEPVVSKLIEDNNKDFPIRKHSIFMRLKPFDHNGREAHEYVICIPYYNANIAFCPEYDFNQHLIDDLDSLGDLTEKNLIGILTVLVQYKDDKMSKLLKEGEINSHSKLYKYFVSIARKLNIIVNEDTEVKPFIEYLSNLKNSGFYTKLAKYITEEDYKKNVEVWTENPVIIFSQDVFDLSKLEKI